MRRIFSPVGLIGALLLGGACAAVLGAEPEAQPGAAPPTTLSFQDLLSKPRSELAELAEEWTTRIQFQSRAHREGRLQFSLLPNCRFPLVVPIFREAKYSAQAGMSLPPYASEGTKDRALALHLARYGDRDAARKLVEPTDRETLRQIDSVPYERNYPLEWTRLAGLALHAAVLRLAAGDGEGLTELIGVHRQLLEALDSKAAKAPLGAALLTQGHSALAEAVAAWKKAKRDDLAAQGQDALDRWGDLPAPAVALHWGMPRSELGQVVGGAGEGRALSVTPLRALDLLGLPFPDEGLEAAIVSFNDGNRLVDLWLTYRTGLSEYYPEPFHLARRLEDHGLTGTEAAKETGVRRCTYKGAGLEAEVATISHGAGAGVLVRLGAPEKAQSRGSLPRDFGAVHFDRTFEENRIQLAPRQKNDRLRITQANQLARIINTLGELKPAAASVQREGGHNVTSSLALDFPTDESGVPPLHKVVFPLWCRCGSPEFRGEADEHGGHLTASWQDSLTRYTVHLPYEGSEPVRFEARDCQAPERQAEREAAALAFDREERKARLAANKPAARMKRQLEQIELGTKREQVLQAFPPENTVLRQEFAEGVSLTFTAPAREADPYLLRQLFVVFDKTDRAVELRARYAHGGGPGQTGQWMSHVLVGLEKAIGKPVQAPSSWRNLWAGLPDLKPTPALYCWQDDVTLLSYQSDSSGVEVVLRDRPIESASANQASKPFQYLPRGPENCLLGTTREELLKNWNVGKPVTTDDGALVLYPGGGNYDAVLVWFEKDRVVRILGRHGGSVSGGPAKCADAVSEAWHRDARPLGWPRRHDLTADGALQSLGWHDESTQIRVFWTEGDAGSARLFTEWKQLAN
jgi:hypothetical protein